MITVGLLAVLAIAAAFFAWTFFKQAHGLRARFSGVLDVDSELAGTQRKVDELKRERERFDAEDQERRSKLNAEYDQALTTYKQLKQEVLRAVS